MECLHFQGKPEILLPKNHTVGRKNWGVGLSRILVGEIGKPSKDGGTVQKSKV
jgi:hypothetical protein